MKSNRPFFGWLISLCKRAIRKSTYWLYNPLFTMITQFNQAIIAEIARQSNKNEEAFRTDINHLKSRLYSTLYINPGVKIIPKKDFDYFGFEELFRGNSALLKERLKLYVDYFIGRTNVLDVGCGRGEFLELMQQAGIGASGVDVNPEMVALCKGKGLKVALGDFSSYMDSIPDGSLDGVFSAQFIEHLEPQLIDVFIKKAYKKLAIGGIFVAETVNPYHIANFHFFWVDPTHQRPIYPEVAKFFCWSAGFEDVNLRFFPCFGEIEKNLLEPWDYCDYAVVALKTR